MPGDERYVYATGPGAVLVHGGRIWKSVVRRVPGKRVWGQPLDFLVLSAPADTNPLQASAWQLSTPVHGDPQPPKPWLCDEGNIVPGPDGKLYDILRVDERTHGGLAGLLSLSADGKTLAFDPATGFIEFPGGCKKFTIRHDPVSGLAWSLANWAQDKDRARARNVERQRNTLALTASRDLRHWEVRSVILYDPDVQHVGFQYADWRIDGDDLIVVSRTAFGEAPNCHDANYLTFHRIERFRTRTMNDPPLNAAAGSPRP